MHTRHIITSIAKISITPVPDSLTPGGKTTQLTEKCLTAGMTPSVPHPSQGQPQPPVPHPSTG